MLQKMRQQKLLSTGLVLLTLAVGIVIGTLITSEFGSANAQSGATDATPLKVPAISQIGNDFTVLAKKLESSVVNLTVEVLPDPQALEQAQRPKNGKRKGAPQPPPGLEDEFQDFFRGLIPEGEPQPRQASGTGFIVDPKGYIITNNHVVEGASKILVKLHDDSKEYRARVIGTDCETDLAVIKIDTRKPLKPVIIGNSDSVQVGDWAVAIGSPFGLEATVTAGIVSAFGRNIRESRAFQHFIQTDAAINPGNSGGPLLNIRGEVIGVNTMIATTRGGSEGVGFALPINMAVRVYNDIIRSGVVTRGSIGVTLATVVRQDAAMQALGVEHGAIVETVREGGPAAAAGLKREDIITGINGKPVHDNEELIDMVADLPVGTPATLNVDRAGRRMDLQVIPQDRLELYRDNPQISCGGTARRNPGVTEPTVSKSNGQISFGIELRAALTEQERELSPNGGVAVKKVVEGSFAEEAGVEDNDIIAAINRQPVNSVEDVRRVQQTLRPGDPVVFQVIRRGGPEGRVSVYLAGNLPE
jgi:serine protease Do